MTVSGLAFLKKTTKQIQEMGKVVGGGGNQTMEVNKGLDSACLMPRNNSFGELQGYLKI